MRKISSGLLRIIAAFLAAVSVYLLLLSPVTVKVNNAHQMARDIVSDLVKQSNDPSLKLTAKLVKESGLEDELINNLPKNIELGYSYQDIYQLTKTYDSKGKLTSKDLGFNSKNKLEEVINQFLVAQVNQKLKQEAEKVDHIIIIYRYSIFAILLLYILAIILFIFGRYSASVPLFIGTVVSFGALWLFCQEANNQLQTQVYTGIVFTLDSGIWFGLFVGVIVAAVWPFLLRLSKKRENK